MTKRKIEYWVIPPEQDTEFVAALEDVLELYAKAYTPYLPVLCMDEKPIQLLKERQVPLPARKTHGQRVDYEYERNCTASIFLFAEPRSGPNVRKATGSSKRLGFWIPTVNLVLPLRIRASMRPRLLAVENPAPSNRERVVNCQLQCGHGY